jgi:hypothetical protein
VNEDDWRVIRDIRLDALRDDPARSEIGMTLPL